MKKNILNVLLFIGLCLAAPQVVNANTTCLQVQNNNEGKTVVRTYTKETKTTSADGTVTIERIEIVIYSDGSTTQTKTTDVIYPSYSGMVH